jgi:hypothetical protein
MNETPETDLEKTWENLNTDEKKVCISLAVTDVGLSERSMSLMARGVSMLIVSQLADREIVEVGTNAEFAQKFLTENEKAIAEIEDKWSPLYKPTPEESTFMLKVRSVRESAQSKNTDPRYRLTREMHSYVRDTVLKLS